MGHNMEPGLRGHSDTRPRISSQTEGQDNSTVTSRRVRMCIGHFTFFFVFETGFYIVQPGFELTV